MYTSSAAANQVPHSDEASKYESKHEKSLRQLSEAIQKRLDLIGADWIKDDDDDDDNDGEDATTTTSSSRQVRLLDYACGTGMISRVRSRWPPRSHHSRD